MAPRPQLTYVEGCAGVAGLGLALKLVFDSAARCVGYIERDACAAAALVARMEAQELDSAPVWDDHTTFNGSRYRGKVDSFIAGFSCQPWSCAGQRLGTEDERWIWPTLASTISAMGCWLVFLENVPGLISGGGLEHVLSDFAALGFDAEWDCISASDLEASQERERTYILAMANGSGGCRWRDRLRERCGLESFFTGCCAIVDGSEGARSGGLHESTGRLDASDVNGSGEALGRADGKRGRGKLESREPTADGRCKSQGAGSVLAGVGCEGLEGRECSELQRPWRRVEGRAIAELHSLPLFPPLSQDFPAWESVLSAVPSLAPRISESAFRRMVNGTASRLDRLRLCGNGVVPVAAAAAFVTLARRFLNDET